MKTILRVLPIVVCLAAQASAQDFRIRNRTWFGEVEKPVESVTVFKSGIVYDFLLAPDETVIYDAARQRFITLDPARQVKSETSVADVEQNLQRLRARISEIDKPFAKFMSNPNFVVTQGVTKDDLELKSTWMDYRVKLIAPPAEGYAAQYHAFLNAMCKFGAMNPPAASTPPFGRLALYRILQDRGQLATEVHLTMYPISFKDRQAKMRTEHAIRWSLLAEDDRRIENAANQLVTFKSVGLREFQQPAAEQAKR